MTSIYKFLGDKDSKAWIEKKFYKDTNVFGNENDFANEDLNNPNETTIFEQKFNLSDQDITNTMDDLDETTEENCSNTFLPSEVESDDLDKDVKRKGRKHFLSINFIKNAKSSRKQRGRPKKNYNPYLDFDFVFLPETNEHFVKTFLNSSEEVPKKEPVEISLEYLNNFKPIMQTPTLNLIKTEAAFSSTIQKDYMKEIVIPKIVFKPLNITPQDKASTTISPAKQKGKHQNDVLPQIMLEKLNDVILTKKSIKVDKSGEILNIK